MNKRKLLLKALTGSKNLRFAEAVRLAETLDSDCHEEEAATMCCPPSLT